MTPITDCTRLWSPAGEIMPPIGPRGRRARRAILGARSAGEAPHATGARSLRKDSPGTPRAFLRTIVAVLVGAAVASTGGAIAAQAEEVPDWEFGGTLAWGVHSQGIDGNATSSTSTGVLQDNGDSLISGFFRIGGRLYTPVRAPDVLFKPRLFMTASVYIPIAENLISNAIDQTFNDSALVDLNCATEIPNGNPGPTQPPTIAPDSCNVAVRNRVTMNAMWSAGLGVDLTLPLDQDQFHVLATFQYFGQAFQGGGDFERINTQGTRSRLIERARSVGDSVVYHGISSSLGLYVDVYETSSYKIQLHLEGRAGFKYTERDLRDTAFGDGVAVTYTSTIQNFMAQGSGGLSLFWKGF